MECMWDDKVKLQEGGEKLVWWQARTSSEDTEKRWRKRNMRLQWEGEDKQRKWKGSRGARRDLEGRGRERAIIRCNIRGWWGIEITAGEILTDLTVSQSCIRGVRGVAIGDNHWPKTSRSNIRQECTSSLALPLAVLVGGILGDGNGDSTPCSSTRGGRRLLIAQIPWTDN